MASNASGWGILAAVVGGTVALDTITKKTTAVQRLTQEGYAKDATIRSLRSQVTNAQAVQSNEQRLRTEAQNLARQVAAERDYAKDQLSKTAVKLSAETMAKINAIAERDAKAAEVAAMTKRNTELEAEVARLKAAAARPAK